MFALITVIISRNEEHSIKLKCIKTLSKFKSRRSKLQKYPPPGCLSFDTYPEDTFPMICFSLSLIRRTNMTCVILSVHEMNSAAELQVKEEKV